LWTENYFKRLNALSKAGRLLAQLLRKASGFKPPSRFFNSPPASESVFTVLAACVMLPTLNPCLNIEGLIKLVNEDTLFAILMASETLPAALNQLVLPPLAQLLKKEVGFNAPANCVNRLLGLAEEPPALERTSFNCACEGMAARLITNSNRKDLFGRMARIVMVFFLNITPFSHVKSGRRHEYKAHPTSSIPRFTGPRPTPAMGYLSRPWFARPRPALIRPPPRLPKSGFFQIQFELLAPQQVLGIHFIMTHF